MLTTAVDLLIEYQKITRRRSSQIRKSQNIELLFLHQRIYVCLYERCYH